MKLEETERLTYFGMISLEVENGLPQSEELPTFPGWRLVRQDVTYLTPLLLKINAEYDRLKKAAGQAATA